MGSSAPLGGLGVFLIFKERDLPAQLVTATPPWFTGSGGEEAQEKAFSSLAASPKAASPAESSRLAGKSPVGLSQMGPQSLNREAFGCKQSAQS